MRDGVNFLDLMVQLDASLTPQQRAVAVERLLALAQEARDLAQRLKGLASISDQSGGRTVLRVKGARAREVLAKGLPIDLHPSVFGSGSAATSTISLMGVQLWQVDDAPTYDLAIFRSVSASFA